MSVCSREGLTRVVAVTLAVSCAGMAASCREGDEEARTAAAASERVGHNELSADELEAGWILLFDGQTTAGWRAYGGADFPSGGWSVEDGELVGRSSDGDMDGGDIITEAEFTDFELVFDFKVGPEGNSGVFYRVREREDRALWEVAPEYQVLDDPAYVAMGTMDMHKHLTGDNYDLHAAIERTMNPTGEWNTGRIVARGNRVEHWLNGHRTVAYELYSEDWERRVAESKFSSDVYARAPSGSIGLQDHGTPVWYRDVKIRLLE